MGATPQGNQVPPLEQDVNDDQAPVDPPHLTDGVISAALLQMDQAVTTQAQANREVVPRENQQVCTIASRLKEFTRMNPP